MKLGDKGGLFKLFGLFLVFLFGLVIFFTVKITQEPTDKNPVLGVVLVAYFLRIIFRLFNRSLAIYSDGQTVGGGDSTVYEDRASMIAQLWRYRGLHFVSSEQFPELRDVSLPPNIFGLVEYMNDGYSAVGNVSIVAFCACLTAIILYRTFIVYDKERAQSFWWMVCLLYSMSFFSLTSDSFKEGFIILAVVGIFSGVVHWSRGSNWSILLGLAACFWLLDGTRYYLIYALIPPMMVRVFLPILTSRFRLDLVWMVLAVLLIGVLNLVSISKYIESASDVFELSYGYGTQRSNISGGSGIDIDGGKPTLASLPIKTLYTLFAPFPWQSGSLGLHLSKIEMFFWYFMFYWCYRGVRIFIRRDPDLTLTFLVFIMGLILVYAWSFTNIGLIYRQRLPVFFVASILAVWGRVAAKEKT